MRCPVSNAWASDIPGNNIGIAVAAEPEVVLLAEAFAEVLTAAFLDGTTPIGAAVYPRGVRASRRSRSEYPAVVGTAPSIGFDGLGTAFRMSALTDSWHGKAPVSC